MIHETENLETLINEFVTIVEEINSVKENLYSSYQPGHVFEAEIDEYQHILIVFSSDFHLGSIYTDYKRILEVWKFILEKDGVYLIINGDFIDNFDLPSTKYLLTGLNSQIITPELQRELFLKFINALVIKKKLLACILGNHESFSHQYPYFKLIQNIPVASNRMLLKLRLFYSQTYKIALIHKSRFNSILNPLHANWRELTTMYPDSDIIVTSHTHLPAISTILYPSNGGYTERVLVKTGTLKTDPYTTSHFSHPIETKLSIPCVILNPLERKITPFLDYRDAYKFLLISNP